VNEEAMAHCGGGVCAKNRTNKKLTKGRDQKRQNGGANKMKIQGNVERKRYRKKVRERDIVTKNMVTEEQFTIAL
jgi:hypothetical protein